MKESVFTSPTSSPRRSLGFSAHALTTVSSAGIAMLGIDQGGLCGFVIGVLAVAVVGVVLCGVAVHDALRRPRGPRSDALGVAKHRDAVASVKVSRLNQVRFSRVAVAAS